MLELPQDPTQSMPEASLRDESHYVLLMPNQPETFVTDSELIGFLTKLVEAYPALAEVNYEPSRQAQRLLETTCEVEIAPGETVQWYAVRLEK